MSLGQNELRTHQLEVQEEALRRLEFELAEVRNRYADLYDFAPIAYVTISGKGIILQANLTLAVWLGVDRSQLIRDQFAHFIVPKDNDHWYLYIARVLKHHRRQRCELALKRDDGSCFPAQLDSLPVGNDDKTTLHIALTDISERKRNDAELKKYEAQCRALFENMIDIYYKTDMDGRLQMISPSCLAQTGYTQAEMLGRSVAEFYADPVQRDELFMQLLQQGQVNDFDMALVHKDGSPRIASVTSHLLRDEAGQPVGVEGILRDITRRKQAEQAQQELLQENRALMRRVMQVQEEERRLLARDLHDELGQLLTSIKTRAEFIARHAQDAELRDVAAEIVRDTSASFDASHAMLLKLRPATLDILGLAAALAELTGQWQKQVGTACFLDIDGDIDHLNEMHAIAIYRLVQEGLTNAHRHGKANRVEIVVKHVPPHAGRAGQLLVEINDNGKGLHVQQVRKGMGIIGMRERIHALGGTFLLTDIPSDGVRIEAVLPMNEGGK